jgi:hypothetical protein
MDPNYSTEFTFFPIEKPCKADLHGIYHGQYGVLIFSTISEENQRGLREFYRKKFGYDIADNDIAREFNVELCLTTKHLSEKWKKVLQIDK